MLLSINIASASTEANNGSANLLTMLNTGHTVMLWVFFISTVFFIFTFIAKVVKNKKDRDFMEEEGLLDDDE